MHTIKCKDLETMIKIDGLEELWIWVLNTDNLLRQGQPLKYPSESVDWVKRQVTKVSKAVREDYPFYADELPLIIGHAFLDKVLYYELNYLVFQQLFIITKHLHSEPQDISVWSMVHPRIVLIAKEEYLDGHYASAANRSFVEVETRLRELFKQLKRHFRADTAIVYQPVL